MSRITATPGDAMELALKAFEAQPEAPDEPAMDPREWKVRKALIDLTELPEDDHESRGHQWEHIAELCFAAADAEWRLRRGGEPGRQT